MDRGPCWHYGIWINFNREEKIFHVAGDGNFMDYYSKSNPIKLSCSSEAIQKNEYKFLRK